MMSNRNSQGSKTGIALSVCGAALIAYALANGSETPSIAQRELSDRSDIAKVDETLDKTSAASNFTSSVRKFFGTKAETNTAADANSAKKAKPAQAAKPALAQAWKQSTTRLKYLDRCVETQACGGFSQEDPSSYGLATRMAQAQELRDFTQVVIAWKAEYGGSDLPNEAKTVARHFLKTGNDDVKDAALDLIALSEQSSEDLDALIEALMKTTSGRLVEKAMQKALLPYAGQPKVDRFLLFQMQRGATKPQAAIATNFLPYLTQKNRKEFERAAKATFDTRSESSIAARANLKEFDQMSSGG